MNKKLQIFGSYAILVLGILLIQTVLGVYLAIGSVTPDFVLICIIIIAVRLGQIPATIFGFAAGLILDLYLGEIIGISALAKTVSGFCAGYFYQEEKTDLLIRSPRFALITIVCSILHNTIYLLVYFQRIEADLFHAFMLHGLGSAVYTTAFSAIFILIMARTGSRLKVTG